VWTDGKALVHGQGKSQPLQKKAIESFALFLLKFAFVLQILEIKNKFQQNI